MMDVNGLGRFTNDARTNALVARVAALQKKVMHAQEHSACTYQCIPLNGPRVGELSAHMRNDLTHTSINDASHILTMYARRQCALPLIFDKKWKLASVLHHQPKRANTFACGAANTMRLHIKRECR